MSFNFQFIQLLTNIPIRLNEMWTAPQVAGFMIKPYKSCYILYFLSCFPSVVWNTQRWMDLHLLIYHPLFARVIYHMASEMMFLCLRDNVKGFQMGKDCQKQRELNSFRKSGKNNDLATNSTVYMAKSLVSNVSMKHLSYISNNLNRRWSMTPLHFWDDINNVWENSTWE